MPMKPCPFCDPSVLAGYYEGTLDPEQDREFSRHLLACPRCLEALVGLERDLTLMQFGEFRPLPDTRSGAVFQFGRRGLQLLHNPAGPGGFRTVSLAPVWEKKEPAPCAPEREGTTLHALCRGGVTLSVYPGERGDRREVFCIRLEGVAGKSVLLRCEGRVVERRGAGSRDRVDMENLEPGAYTVYVEGTVLAGFVVQEEAA
jgi:hypothetical protein